MTMFSVFFDAAFVAVGVAVFVVLIAAVVTLYL